MEELIKLPSCTIEKPSSMRFVYDKVTVHIREFAALGIKSDHYGGLLVPIVMTRLPPELRLRFIRDTIKEVWEIDELMGVLKKEVEARESADLVKSCGPKSQATSFVASISFCSVAKQLCSVPTVVTCTTLPPVQRLNPHKNASQYC